MFSRLTGLTVIAALGACPLLADFSYQEKSTITGGAIASMMKVVGVFSKAAREPIQSTVSVKGDRMMHRSATHASIIDLNSQTITNIDFQKKQYSVATFDDMKRMMAEMQQKMEHQKADNGDNVQMDFKVSPKNTGNTKEIGGYNTKETVFTMEMQATDATKGQQGSMVITSDMWIAPSVSGYNEVRDFYKRMAEKLDWTPGGNMFMSQPQAARGMAEVYKQVGKLDGMPVFQTITMGAAGQPGADGTQSTTPQRSQQSTTSSSSTVGGGLTGALGSRLGLGRKKQQQDSSNDQASGGGQNAGVLLQMNTEMTGFSAAPVDGGQFDVPSGFKKVEWNPKTSR